MQYFHVLPGNSYSDSELNVLLNPNVTKEDLIKFKQYFDLHPSKAKQMQWEWEEISRSKLSDDFINIFSDYLSWSDISEYQDLSEEMIEKYANKVNWRYISKFQNLSEDFIRKHKNDVDWKKISYYQENLSIPFIEEFINYLDLERNNCKL